MRISDWSSDVCSSDLDPVALEHDLHPLSVLSLPVVEAGIGMRRHDTGFVGSAAHGLVGGGTGGEIGRASCRESVCQYVYISVVAVSLKKKTSKHKNDTYHECILTINTTKA